MKLTINKFKFKQIYFRHWVLKWKTQAGKKPSIQVTHHLYSLSLCLSPVPAFKLCVHYSNKSSVWKQCIKFRVKFFINGANSLNSNPNKLSLDSTNSSDVKYSKYSKWSFSLTIKVPTFQLEPNSDSDNNRVFLLDQVKKFLNW